ncbi:MAG TPA: response regulator, partial [Gammaproteobacteria bacterium]
MNRALEVWVVDDDASIRWVLERALGQAGMRPRTFEQADGAIAALGHGEPDVLVTDIRMPGASGLKLLEALHRTRPALPVIVMT